MTTFLERILQTKQEEVRKLKSLGRTPQTATYGRARKGFRAAIASARTLAVIAEVKKASPSKGLIAPDFDPVAIAQTYQAAGATCISVLTDQQYFQGSVEYLELIRNAVDLPLLRKDFIIDESQIDEALDYGADAILLICAALSPQRIRELSVYAQSNGLDVLVEVHSTAELDAALSAEPSVLGVNNRNLHTFEVSLNTTREVLKNVPASQVVISESGIHSAADAVQMASCGAHGVLVGESLMKAGANRDVTERLQSFCVPRVETVRRR